MKMNLYRASTANFPSLLRRKAGFLAKVYGILALEIAVMAITAELLRRHQQTAEKIQQYSLLWFLVSFMLIFGIIWTKSNPPLALALFTAFAVTIGLTSIAASKYVSADSIKVAFIATALLFVALSVLGGMLLAAGIDLSFLGFLLLAMLIALCIVFIVMTFVPVSKKIHRIVLGFAIVLFSIFIAFDTNIMLQKGFTDPIDAALNLFLDIVNLFTDIVAFDNT
jgi:modulator of FtsH protease